MPKRSLAQLCPRFVAILQTGVFSPAKKGAFALPKAARFAFALAHIPPRSPADSGCVALALASARGVRGGRSHLLVVCEGGL